MTVFGELPWIHSEVAEVKNKRLFSRVTESLWLLLEWLQPIFIDWEEKNNNLIELLKSLRLLMYKVVSSM